MAKIGEQMRHSSDIRYLGTAMLERLHRAIVAEQVADCLPANMHTDAVRVETEAVRSFMAKGVYKDGMHTGILLVKPCCQLHSEPIPDSESCHLIGVREYA